MMRWLIVFTLFVSPAAAECPDLPPGLGGVADSQVDEATALKWKTYRAERERERLLEAYDPARVRATYRVSDADVNDCLTFSELVDVGRALFLRSFTPEEGLGHGDRDRPLLKRFQRGTFGGPDAMSCASCHWKGGFAGGGDRVDNAFLGGDGDRIDTHDERNPIALWGAGWVELTANIISSRLQEIAADVDARAAAGGTAEQELIAGDVSFGTLRATLVDGDVVRDLSAVSGVDEDLVIRPFGWQGSFATVREMVTWSFHVHLGMQAEETIQTRPAYLDFGDGPSDDPDSDGIVDELTTGQITAVTAFLVTLDAPIIEVPTTAGWRPDPMLSTAIEKSAPEFTERWPQGQAVFGRVGCTACHTPTHTVPTTTLAITSDLVIDLATAGARPRPGVTIPLFSDLKRHDMGEAYAARGEGAHQGASEYITRPLWGLRNSAPYMHDGSANTLDDAVAMHGAEGSAAKASADAFAALTENEKADVRVFLYALTRAPAIRVR